MNTQKKNNVNKKNMTDEYLRKEAFSNYKFYLECLTREELEAECKRIENEAIIQNDLLKVPDFDDNADGDIVMEHR